MEYPHERLERLIDYLPKTHANGGSLSVPDLHTYKNLFIEETLNIKTFLNRKSLPIENERNFELLIHQYQSLVVFWLDKIFDSHAKKIFSYPKEVVELVRDQLEKLLCFMHDRYERFFNQDEKVPEILLKEIRQNLKGRVQKLRCHLLKEFLNEEHTELALSPLKNLLNSDLKKKITYRYLFYTRRIEKVLSTFNNAVYTGCSYPPLIQLMVLMNYNHSEALLFFINKMISDIEILENMEDKKDRLRFFLKELNQLKERTDIACKPLAASLKEQAIGWISEEITYIGGAEPSHNTAKLSITSEEKIHLSISVEVFTLIGRAAKDNKVITNKHNTEVFKNLSKYVSTKKTETLSVNSLIKKSYVAQKRAKDAAIDVLHGLIKKIHEY